MGHNRRIVVAVSGGGRTLTNFLSQQRKNNRGYEVCGVISSRPDCRGAVIAKEQGLPLLVARFHPETMSQTEAKVYAFLEQVEAGWVALGGFLKKFPVHKTWENRVVNIHPALLPKFGGPGFYGDRVHQAVLEAGERVTGATVHFVNDRYDEGPIIAQIVVPLRPHDTPQSLSGRVFAAECELYPRVMEGLVSGQLPLQGGGVMRIDYGMA